MAKLDPFVIQFPRKWLTDPEIGPFAVYLNRWLHDLFIRTGGGDDLINDNQISEIFGGQTVEIKDLDVIELAAGSTTITTTGDQFIVCNNTASGTIVLNTKPQDGEDVFVARKNGSITVNGAINGGTTFKLNGKKSSIHFKFTIIANEWTPT